MRIALSVHSGSMSRPLVVTALCACLVLAAGQVDTTNSASGPVIASADSAAIVPQPVNAVDPAGPVQQPAAGAFLSRINVPFTVPVYTLKAAAS